MATAMQVMHSSASSNHQQTPGSTAPVLEYVCLFTRDLRRKQKRWQDGRLKYHTFNKRIMVYDERGNFVGDTHWHEDYDFDEGEEVELERGGTIVQVAECTGSRDQDISELIDKRARERAERQSAALARRPPIVEAATPNVAAPHFQLRHKPLHNLIGTPTGHHGRALVPTESPYEERQKLAASVQENDARPAKRRKREVSPPSKSGYAQSLFGASLTLSGTPASSPLLRSRPPKVTSVSADDRPLSSAIPSAHAGDSGAEPILIHDAPTRIQEEAQANTSGLALSRKVYQEHQFVSTRDSVKPQPLPLFLGDKPNINDQCDPPFNKRQSGPRRRDRTGGQPIEIDTLQPISANLGLKSHESNKRHYGDSALGNIAPAVDLIDRGTKGPPSVLGPKESVRSQNLTTEPKPRNKAEADDSNNECLGLAQRQPISESRTELRIKPRKKRGLVMVSEKLNSDSSSKRASKNQIDCQYPPAPPSDITKGYSNDGMFDDDISIDTGVKELDHTRRMTQNAPLCNPSQVNPKSAYKQGTRIKKDRRKIQSAKHSEDDPAISDSEIQSELFKDMGTCAYYDQTNDESSSFKHEHGVQAEATKLSRNRSGSSRKKKLRTKDNVDSHSTAEKKDTEKQIMTDGDDLGLPDDVPAPRLAQLGRRNVRSKEVIGFFFDEEIDSGPQRREGGEYGKASLASGFSANHSTAQPPLDNETRAVSNRAPPEFVEDRNIGAVDVEAISCLPRKQTRPTSARVSGNSDVQALSDDTAATRLPAAKMVVNPATRGKKAAKPSDAAGHVPQCPLPLEAALGKPPDTKRHEHDEQNTTSKIRREASVAMMPVFARANGGPWSREAHDLFEFARPP
ncbi:hypothetical protein F4813DRAFT_111227 [Daldinia decipiens]|uniref:uncharacterized protein n=1 Tax=Daldinia decipiens TaxID=326647 RepID=UPI0020C46620|nr:uncharacterized protein F4813DRAFT_111227 [Daldinia decipiens]KAI1662499.1 hypothetical protein F4813DRAFT_111227 [Daldinia decipiens]